MKRYPAYKDSGVDWIGGIPYHWSNTKLKWLVHYRLLYGANEAAELDDPDLPRYIRITDFSDNGKLKNETFRSLPVELAKDYLLSHGDILFARSGATVGKTFQFKNCNGQACFAGYLIKATPDESKIISDYLYLYTKSGCYENWKNSIFSQATIQNIGAEKYQNLLVPNPPIKEQTAIAKYLDHKTHLIDTLIEKKQKQIELLQEQRATIINQAVTKGLNPNVKMKDSGIEWLGEVPEHWRKTLLKHICSVRGRIGFRGYTSEDQVDEDQGALTLGATQIDKNGFMDLSKPVYLSWEKYYESPEIMLSKGDILIVQRGSTCGKIGLLDKEIGSATINPSLIVLKNISILGEFLFYFLNSSFLQNRLHILLSSTAIPMLTQEQINNLPILVSNAEEQGEIVKYLNNITKDIYRTLNSIEKEIVHLQEYRTTLISEVVTGKIDVRDEVIP